MLISYTDKELDLLARIMRAEALSDGKEAMLMVGNVVVNRVLADCDVFKKLTTINKVIYEKNAFTGTKNSLFNSSSTKTEKNLAKRCLKGEYYHPATHALWFYSPTNSTCKNNWYNQELAGKFKSHCFYMPAVGTCKKIR